MNKKIQIDKEKLRPLTPTDNPFASLVRSVIFQQLSGKAASAILTKFIKLWPRKKFPNPKDVLILSDEQFRSAGVSLQKANYIRDLATKFLDKTIDPKQFHAMNDQQIIEHLTLVKGIGEWTAHMFLIFALNRPDVLPTGDLAIKKGFMKVFGLRSMPDSAKMHALAKPHTGERTVLSLYLWDSLEDNAGGW